MGTEGVAAGVHRIDELEEELGRVVSEDADLPPGTAEAVLVGVPRGVLGEVGHPQVDLVAGLRAAQPLKVHLVRRPLVALGVGGVGVRARPGGRVVV